MRDLNAMECASVSGGEGLPDRLLGPSRQELEMQMEQLMQLLEDQALRNAHKGALTDG